MNQLAEAADPDELDVVDGLALVDELELPESAELELLPDDSLDELLDDELLDEPAEALELELEPRLSVL